MPYELNAPVTRSIEAPSGSATPVATLTKPDGTTATPTVTDDGSGSWSYEATLDQAGTWLESWTVTGVGLVNGGFYVRPAPSLATALVPVVTVVQARDFLKADGQTAADTANLAELCRAATYAADYHCRIARQVEATVTAIGGYLLLPRTPVQSLVSITASAGTTAVALADLDKTAATGRVFRTDGVALRGEYTVTYVAGNFPDEAIEQGALEWIQHRWRASQAHSSSSYGEDPAATDFRDLPNAVRQSWLPYLDEDGVA